MISKLPINQITSDHIYEHKKEVEMIQNGIDPDNNKPLKENYPMKLSLLLENSQDIKDLALKNPDFSNQKRPEEDFNDVKIFKKI